MLLQTYERKTINFRRSLLFTQGGWSENTVFFRQGKNSDTDGITYHNNNSVSDYIGAEMCEILSCFHVLTVSDYTNLFFGRTKVQSFKLMVAVPSSVSLLSSMSKNVDIPAVIKFILQIIYNRPKTEKTPGETRYRMLFKKRETRGNFCLLNPVLQIKVLSKWKFYAALLSSILRSAAWTDIIFRMAVRRRLLGTNLVWGKCFTECRGANRNFAGKL